MIGLSGGVANQGENLLAPLRAAVGPMVFGNAYAQKHTRITTCTLGYRAGVIGAALLAKNGMVYTGCNIENAGYTPTNCAERTALFKAISEGVTEFTDIAIVGSLDGKKNTLVTGPCGVCRQALYEFCGPRLRVLMAKSEDDYIETTLGDLLPYGFGPTNLEIEPGAD